MGACKILSLASFQLAVYCRNDNISYWNRVEIVVRCRRTANPLRDCRPFYRAVPQTLSACQLLVSARIEYSPYILGPRRTASVEQIVCASSNNKFTDARTLQQIISRDYIKSSHTGECLKWITQDLPKARVTWWSLSIAMQKYLFDCMGNFASKHTPTEPII